MRVIGLTGGIGTGKSEVAKILAELGAEVIDADQEGHLSYKHGGIGWGRIVAFFGTEVLNDEGEVDRKALGEIVFGNPEALALLNSAIHPLIRQRIQRRLEELRTAGANAAVVNAALLYQAGWHDLVDEVWAVIAPASVVIPRLEARGLAQWDARRRMEMQEPVEKLAARADVVIENTGPLEELQGKVSKLWNERIFLTRQ